MSRVNQASAVETSFYKLYSFTIWVDMVRNLRQFVPLDGGEVLCDKIQNILSMCTLFSVIRAGYRSNIATLISQNLFRINIGLIHVFEVVNNRRGPKNGLPPECEA